MARENGDRHIMPKGIPSMPLILLILEEGFTDKKIFRRNLCKIVLIVSNHYYHIVIINNKITGTLSRAR
jgi:hypothetical protein